MQVTDEKQEIYFAWPKSATVSPVLHGTGTIASLSSIKIGDYMTNSPGNYVA